MNQQGPPPPPPPQPTYTRSPYTNQTPSNPSNASGGPQTTRPFFNPIFYIPPPGLLAPPSPPRPARRHLPMTMMPPPSPPPPLANIQFYDGRNGRCGGGPLVRAAGVTASGTGTGGGSGAPQGVTFNGVAGC